jgi:hypothetical protein
VGQCGKFTDELLKMCGEYGLVVQNYGHFVLYCAFEELAYVDPHAHIPAARGLGDGAAGVPQ